MTLELWSFGMGLRGAELRGMSVEARDGSVGTVQDVVDQPGGAHLLVDTGRWIFGKTVVVPAGVVHAVDHDRQCVLIGCSREDVKNAPQHDPDASDAATREAIGAYYGEIGRPDDRAAPDSATHPVSAGLPSAGAETDIASRFPGAAQPNETADRAESPESGAPVIGSSPEAVGLPRAESDLPDADRASGTTTPNQPGGAPGDARQDAQPEHGTTSTAGEAATPQLGVERESSGETPTPSGPAPEAAAHRGDQDAGDQDEARPTRRFTRESGDAKDTSGSAEGSGSRRSARTSSSQPPIAGYDSLTAAEVIARLRNLSQRELERLERYEQRHDGRQTILSRIASLREDEPWRGYDDATVPEIRRTLADADEDRAKAVRDYERRHRDRKGVMEAARRAVASA
jgi:hypothetical protein